MQHLTIADLIRENSRLWDRLNACYELAGEQWGNGAHCMEIVARLMAVLAEHGPDGESVTGPDLYAQLRNIVE